MDDATKSKVADQLAVKLSHCAVSNAPPDATHWRLLSGTNTDSKAWAPHGEGWIRASVCIEFTAHPDGEHWHELRRRPNE